MATETPTVTPTSSVFTNGSFGPVQTFGTYATATHFKWTVRGDSNTILYRGTVDTPLVLGDIYDLASIPSIRATSSSGLFHGATSYTLRNYITAAGLDESAPRVVQMNVLYLTPSFTAVNPVSSSRTITILPGNSSDTGNVIFTNPFDSPDPAPFMKIEFGPFLTCFLPADGFTEFASEDILEYAANDLGATGIQIKADALATGSSYVRFYAAKTGSGAGTGVSDNYAQITVNFSSGPSLAVQTAAGSYGARRGFRDESEGL